jgi:hypothetical protein
MKKYSRIVSVFLLTALVMGKSVFASSARQLSADKAAGWLRNLRMSIRGLIEPLSADNDEEERGISRYNLEKASKHELLRPILVRAFEEEKKGYEDVAIKKRASKAVQDIFWKDFYAVRKTYLGK